jgi:hypothetical protein
MMGIELTLIDELGKGFLRQHLRRKKPFWFNFYRLSVLVFFL